MGLGGPGGERRGLAEPNDLECSGLASVVGDESLDQVVFGRLDLLDA